MSGHPPFCDKKPSLPTPTKSHLLTLDLAKQDPTAALSFWHNDKGWISMSGHPPFCDKKPSLPTPTKSHLHVDGKGPF